MEKKIGIASDHAGYEMKEFLVGYLAAKGWDVLDFGPESEESVDYPDFAHPLANAIESGELERGIGLRGSERRVFGFGQRDAGGGREERRRRPRSSVVSLV